MGKIKQFRPRWPKDWPIFYKMVAGLVALVVLALSITTYVNAAILQNELREQIGLEFATLAEAEMRHLADILSEQFTVLQNIAVLDQLRIDAASSNVRYKGDAQDIEAQLLALELEWQTSADDSQLVRSRVNPVHSSLAFQLLTYQDTFPGHVEIVLTDAFGALLAATSRKPGYYHADESWWQAAYNQGSGSFYIGQPQKDENSGYAVLPMAAPVFSEQGELIGVVGTIFRMDAIQKIVTGVQFGRTGRIVLTDASGLVLADSRLEHVGQLQQQIFPLFVRGGVSAEKPWYELKDDNGQAVLAGYARIADIEIEQQGEAQAIHTLGWFLFAQQAQSEAYAPVNSAIRAGRLAVIVFALLVTILAFFVVRMLIAPLGDLMSAAQSMAAGDLGARALVRRRDETGQLAQALNTMAERLNDMVTTLERRVDERTQGLLAAAEVSRATTVLLDPDELLRQVVNLVRERFDLYYVGLFLLDEAQEFAVLRAGTGKAGQQMLASEHKLRMGGDSMIGQCVFRDEPRIALDVGAEAVRFNNPHLPNTRSEMALPLRSRGRVIGAMTVQSVQEAAFDETDVAILQTMADQVAVAIDNARLFSETQAALRDIETTHRRYLQQEWREYYQASDLMRYESGPLGASLPEIKQVIERGQVAALDRLGDGESDATGRSALAAPIELRSERIGVLGVRDNSIRRWTEDEKALIQAIADRMALAAENLRLVEGTQRRAVQEQLTREITDKMRRALDMEALMQTTIREAVAGLDVSDAFVQLTTLPLGESQRGAEQTSVNEHDRPAASPGQESEPEKHV